MMSAATPSAAGAGSIRQRQQHKQKREREKEQGKGKVKGKQAAATDAPGTKSTGKRRVTKAVITNPFTLEW